MAPSTAAVRHNGGGGHDLGHARSTTGIGQETNGLPVR